MVKGGHCRSAPEFGVNDEGSSLISTGDKTGGKAEEAATARDKEMVGPPHLAHPVVPHIGLHEAPQRARLDIGRIDYETRRVRQVLQRGIAEQMMLIGGLDAVADPSGQHQAEDDRLGIDRLAGERAHRRDHLVDKILLQPRGIEAELAPFEPQEDPR